MATLDISERLYALFLDAELDPQWEHGGQVLSFTVNGLVFWTGYASWADAGCDDENGHYWLIDIGLDQDEPDENKIVEHWAAAITAGLAPESS